MAHAGQRLARAGGENALHSVALGGSDPQVILLLHGDLPGDVTAAVRCVRRQPSGGIAITFLFVGGTINGQEFKRIVIQLLAPLKRQRLCPGLPGVADSYDMVYLYGQAGACTPDKVNVFACVRVMQGAAEYSAVSAGPIMYTSHIPPQNVFAHVAAADSCPLAAKLFAGVAGHGCAALDRQRAQRGSSRAGRSTCRRDIVAICSVLLL